MHKLIFIVLLVISIKTSGQANIICPGLKDSSLNYFYIGIDNPIEVTGIKMSANNKISITGGAASIMSVDRNKHIVRTGSVSDSCFIIIFAGKKEIFRKQFKTRLIGDTYATLAGVRDTSVKKNHILFNPFLSVVIPGCYYRFYFQVTSFETIFVDGTDSNAVSASGSVLSGEQIALVKNALRGTKIIFDNIRVNGPDSRTRKLAPFWIKIE